MRVLELFCGIGGLAAAVAGRASIVAAVDQDAGARATYSRNFPNHPLFPWNLAGLPLDRVAALSADLWWMSPPCQPFTTRGLGRDLDDPRCRPFVRVVDLVARLRPPWVALENVPAFSGSRAHGMLLSRLEGSGYRCLEQVLCPTHLGIPSARRRYYLVAGLGTLPASAEPSRPEPLGMLRSFLDSNPSPDLYVEPDLLARYQGAIRIVEADEAAPLSCFTSGYGRSVVQSGAYLRDEGGVRRFSPAEVLRFLGFPADFTFPQALGLQRRWALAGNSLSVPAVRAVLAPLFDQAHRQSL